MGREKRHEMVKRLKAISYSSMGSPVIYAAEEICGAHIFRLCGSCSYASMLEKKDDANYSCQPQDQEFWSRISGVGFRFARTWGCGALEA